LIIKYSNYLQVWETGAVRDVNVLRFHLFRYNFSHKPVVLCFKLCSSKTKFAFHPFVCNSNSKKTEQSEGQPYPINQLAGVTTLQSLDSKYAQSGILPFSTFAFRRAWHFHEQGSESEPWRHDNSVSDTEKQSMRHSEVMVWKLRMTWRKCHNTFLRSTWVRFMI
jgi:hypothetical protein